MLLLVAIVTGICMFTPFFNVKNIDVIGNEQITSEQILTSAAIPSNVNIFRVNKRTVRKSVLKIPEIESVKIRRKLPAKLQLEVVETKAALYFPYLTGYAITNKEGRVLSVSDSEEGLDLLKITGLEIKNAEICEKISVQDTVIFDIILSTIRSFDEKGLLPEIRSCHFDNVSDYYFYLKDGTKVILGKTGNLDYKLSVLTQILPQVNRTEGAYIDLTTPERSVYGLLDPEEPAEEETVSAETADSEEVPEEDGKEAKGTEDSDERS